MKYKSWQDLGGFFHLTQSPPIGQSENGPLFTAEVALFAELNNFQISPIDISNLKLNDVTFTDRYNGKFPAHVSHDNMTGFHCLKALGYTAMDLPIIRWDSVKNGVLRKYWLHPRDVIAFLSLSNALFSPLAVLLLLFAMVSYLKPRNETSGKCMWFLRFGVMSVSKNYILKIVGKLGLALGNKLMVKYHGEKPFIDVFSYYFKDENHPCRVEIKEWYRE